MKYSEVYADHTFLWSIDSAVDMTGAYVDQKDLSLMLENPTKAQAIDCLENQMIYWFQEGTEQRHSYDELCIKYPRLEEIREKYNFPRGEW